MFRVQAEEFVWNLLRFSAGLLFHGSPTRSLLTAEVSGVVSMVTPGMYRFMKVFLQTKGRMWEEEEGNIPALENKTSPGLGSYELHYVMLRFFSCQSNWLCFFWATHTRTQTFFPFQALCWQTSQTIGFPQGEVSMKKILQLWRMR